MHLLNPVCVLHLVEQDIDTILSQGRAEVKIGGRPFEIGADFVQDLKHRLSTDHIKKLSHDLLILHAPHDAIVGIDNAAAILLQPNIRNLCFLLIRLIICSAKQMRQFAADMISAWARRCLGEPAKLTRASEGEVDVNTSSDGDFAQDILAGEHNLRADEPVSVPDGLNRVLRLMIFCWRGWGPVPR